MQGGDASWSFSVLVTGPGKQGHPAVKINFKQQLSHKGCCCVVEDDCVQCSAGLGTVLHSCHFWSLSIWVELCTHLLRLAPL